MSDPSPYLPDDAPLEDKVIEVFLADDEQGEDIEPTEEQKQGFSLLIDEAAKKIQYSREKHIREHGPIPLDCPTGYEVFE